MGTEKRTEVRIGAQRFGKSLLMKDMAKHFPGHVIHMSAKDGQVEGHSFSEVFIDELPQDDVLRIINPNDLAPEITQFKWVTDELRPQKIKDAPD